MEFVVTTAALWAWLTWLGWPQSDIAPFSILTGQTLVVVRVVLGLATNPLNQSAVLRHIDNPTVLYRAPSEVGKLGKVAVELGLLEFHPVLTARQPGIDGAAGDAMFDVLQSRDGHTTAALGRNSGTITLISRLTDGRLLASANLLIPPHSRLIVNQGSGGLDALVREHRRLSDGLSRQGIHFRSAPPTLLTDLLLIEHESYRELGPFLAPFLALESSRRPFRLALRLDPTTVIQRSNQAASGRTADQQLQPPATPRPPTRPRSARLLENA